MKGCRNIEIFVPILVTIFVLIVHYGCGCRGKQGEPKGISVKFSIDTLQDGIDNPVELNSLEGITIPPCDWMDTAKGRIYSHYGWDGYEDGWTYGYAVGSCRAFMTISGHEIVLPPNPLPRRNGFEYDKITFYDQGWNEIKRENVYIMILMDSASVANAKFEQITF